MESDRTPEPNVLDRLLTELGLSFDNQPGSEEAAPLYRLTPDLAQAELDARQTRILERTMRWIGFLQDQAEELTSVAARLYEQLAASNSVQWREFIATGDEWREAVIDRLEWTLASLEYWIEEQKPPDDRARFWVRWTADDGLAWWVARDGERAEPTSLRAVVEDGAETEGEFPRALSTEIAVLVVTALRSAEINLLRLRRVGDESRPEESVFELLPRGEAFKAALAEGEELTPVLPAEAEAPLADYAAFPLAAFLDNASYATATEYAGAASGDSFETDVVDAVTQIAVSCHLQKADVVRCLLSLANQQLDSAVRGGDHVAIVRLGRVVKGLAAFVLQQRQT